MSAALLAVLGAVLAAAPDKAEVQARRALAEAERKKGPDSVATASSLNELAVVVHGAGRSDEAAALARRAYEIFVRDGLESEPVATVLYNMATIERDRGRYAQARAFVHLAVHVRRALKADIEPDLSAHLALAGDISRALERNDEALSLLNEAVAAREASGRPQTLSTLERLAAVLSGRDRKAAAEVLRRALALAEQTPQMPAATIADLLERLGDAEASDDARASLAHYRQALAIREANPSEDPWALAVDLGHLAMEAQSRGAFEESDALYARVLVVLETHLGIDDPRVIDTYWKMGVQSLMFRENQRTKTYEFWRRAFEGIERRVARTDLPDRRDLPHASLLAGNLAQDQARNGDLAGAEDYLRRLVAVNQSVYGEGSGSVAEALAALAEFHREHKQLEEAAERYRAALAIYERSDKVDYEGHVRPILITLAKLAEGRGDVDGAVTSYERLVSAEMQQRRYSVRTLTGPLHTLAALEQRRGRLARAEEHHRRALDAVQSASLDREAAAEVLEAYASFLADVGREGEAAHLRAAAASLK